MDGFDSQFERDVTAYQLAAREKKVAALIAEGMRSEDAERAIPPINNESADAFLQRSSATYQWSRQAEEMHRLTSNK